MKILVAKLVLFLCLISSLTLIGQAGNTIDFDDNGTCGIFGTLTFQGTDATGRHIYADNVVEIFCQWNNVAMQWEFRASALNELVCFSTEATSPNPPDAATGNYQAGSYFGLDCLGMTGIAISGTGTQPAGGPTPVELSTFQGENKTLEIELLWQTTSEINNAGFQIERSLHGNEWETLAFVEGKGTTSDLQTYTYIDPVPHQGNNYYRLKQVDFDGTYSYSDAIVIAFQSQLNQGQLLAFPIPATNLVNYRIDNLPSINRVYLLDLYGRIMATKTTIDGYLSLDGINPGMYILSVGNDHQEWRKRIIKR